MPDIQILSPHLADLIAAGEVVERPASVVKELVENAFDAGARTVTVELRGGGATYLRVTDDGCGMAPEDAGIAFLRHATSKLHDEQGLEAIGTMGFRGEALAAISAVSHITLTTRQRGAASGTHMTLDAGDIQDMYETGCPEGTTMIVRDLFFNTPARRKFLKSDRAEGAACAAAALRCALGRPDVSVRCIRDGEEVFFSPGDNKLDSCVYSLLGRDLAMSLLPCEGESDGARVHGFISSPAAGRGSRAQQYFFCNGRWIRSAALQAALEQAYRNTLLVGRFPACVLYVELSCAAVDVNVHPAKTVVKFVSDKMVFDAVYHTVTSALDEEGRPPKPAEKPFFQTMTAAEFRARPDAPAPKSAVAVPEGRAVGSAPARTYTPVSAPAPAAPVLEVRDVAPEPGKPFTAPASRPGTVYHITPPAPAAVPEPVPAPEPEPEPAQQTIELPDAPAREEAPWRIAGEVLKTYIICEDGDGAVWLIDKHAAHERVRFDALKASPVPPMAQQLLTPAAVNLDGEAYSAVLDNLPLLERCGFQCEDFGGGTVLVRALPDDVPAAEAASTLEELAQKLLLQRADPEGLRDDLLHTIACKSAIKAGMTSDVTELAALVRRVQSGEIRYCPHGRPVAAKLTRYEVEKMFKRA